MRTLAVSNIRKTDMKLLIQLLKESHLCASDSPVPIAAPSMWTRKDIKDFKVAIKKEPESVIKVGPGETITVSMPTLILYLLAKAAAAAVFHVLAILL